jgi:hypothetical protein
MCVEKFKTDVIVFIGKCHHVFDVTLTDNFLYHVSFCTTLVIPDSEK